LSNHAGLSKGLIINTPFIDWILAGRKTWELRTQQTLQRGPNALIQKGSGQGVGDARLIGSKGPLTDAEMEANVHLHAVSLEQLRLPDLAKCRRAWVFANAKRLPRAVSYVHPSGAVKWVTLAPAVAHAAIFAAA
jgi:hypothetical protein